MKKSLAFLTAIFLLTTALSSGSARAADAVISDPATTSIGVITGGDAGEGLDLDGNFVYALAIGEDPSVFTPVKVRDAEFSGLLDDNGAGATIDAGFTNPKWYVIDYGDSANDDNLEAATSTIRWSQAGASPQEVTLTLGSLEVSAQYKLQLMFGEQCCNRGFDVLINDILAVKDFNPGFVHGGIAQGAQEALITHSFSNTSPTLVIRLDGNTASTDYPDHNAILNAITLEKLTADVDSDGDGLSDAWEQLYFKNLSATASGDPDNDGLTNAEELTAGLDPTLPDTDNDGLNDGPELKTHKTSPLRPDTDGDGLKDGEEVTTYKSDPLKPDTDGDTLADGAEVVKYKTDPLKADTDGDGSNDFEETLLGTDPTNKDNKSPFTTIGVISGGDPGEGLDLQGNFVYALAVGAGDDAVVKVGDASFQPFSADEVPGATLVAANGAAHWYEVVYGDSEADKNLSLATSSIRFQGPVVELTLANLEVGGQYKLQLMFGEQCCNRGFGLFVDDALVVKEFNPGVIHGGIGTRKTEALITHTFFAKSTSVNLKLDVRAASFPDPNPILNAATLELVEKAVDSDGDGLWDGWEKAVFGNLDQKGDGDPDADGLNNSQEFAAGANPTKADSDGDGLNDSAEKAAGTNPSNPDSDNDGVSDYVELNSTFSNIVIQSFSGGDPGEGLDLQGNFRNAVNVSTAGAAGKAGDADFTADNVPGVTVIAPNNIPNWDTPEYGDSAADDVIEKVTQSIRYGPTMSVQLTGLVPGSTYKLQLLFFEQCCAGRGFNVYADGKLIAGDFSPPEIQGGVNNTAAGAVISAEFVTKLDKLLIVLTVNGRTREDLTDPNAILDGLTLEVLNEPVSNKFTGISLQGANVVLTWTGTGTLQSADAVTGPYADVAGAASPRSVPVATGPKYYRFKP